MTMKKAQFSRKRPPMMVLAVIIVLHLVTAASLAATGPSLEITDYPAQLSLEKGWSKYVTVQLNNSGTADLHRVALSVEGIPETWVEQQTPEISVLPAGKSANFTLRFMVPGDARTQRYIVKFTAASDEASDAKISDVGVFGSSSEVILQDIQSLRSRLNYLNELANIAEREGKNATAARTKLARADEILAVAESYLYKKMYDEDVVLLQSARSLLDLTEADMENLPDARKPPPIFTVPALEGPSAVAGVVVAAAILGSAILFFAFKSAERLLASRARGSYIKELKTSVREAPAEQIVKGLPSTVESYVEEKARLMRLLSGLESDYSSGKLSKESFSELKLKYESRIAGLTNRRKAQQAAQR